MKRYSSFNETDVATTRELGAAFAYVKAVAASIEGV